MDTGTFGIDLLKHNGTNWEYVLETKDNETYGVLWYLQILKNGENVLPGPMYFPNGYGAAAFAIGYVFALEKHYEENPFLL